MSFGYGLVGCGRIGKRHAREILKVGRLVAVCDSNQELAREMGKEYNVPYYTSLELLLLSSPDTDVISICTPNGLHARQSIESLKAGKHVLCEKPMSISTADAKSMIDAAVKADRKLMIVKSARYNPLLQDLNNLINKDLLGNIYSFNLNCVWNRPISYFDIDWKGTKNMDGGTLYTQFSHYIDAIIWLMGGHKKMCGFRKNFHHPNSISFEDTGVLAVQMQSGALGSIHYTINAHEKNHEIGLTIVAEHGTIQIGGPYANELLYQMPVLLDVNNPAYHQLAGSNHDFIYQNISKAINGDEHFITDGIDAMKTVAFIEEFYQQTELL